MNRLEKFIEKGGKEPGRVAYALGARKLPAPQAGAKWHPLPDFNAAEELLKDASLKGVYQVAIADGFAVLPEEDGR